MNLFLALTRCLLKNEKQTKKQKRLIFLIQAELSSSLGAAPIELAHCRPPLQKSAGFNIMGIKDVPKFNVSSSLWDSSVWTGNAMLPATIPINQKLSSGNIADVMAL